MKWQDGYFARFLSKLLIALDLSDNITIIFAQNVHEITSHKPYSLQYTQRLFICILSLEVLFYLPQLPYLILCFTAIVFLHSAVLKPAPRQIPYTHVPGE